MMRHSDHTPLDEVIRQSAGELTAPAAAGPIPTEPPPPRSPALRDQDLAQVIQLAQEAAPAPRLCLEVATEGPARSWIARALQTVRGLSGGIESGTAFASAPVQGEPMACDITAHWQAGQEAFLRVDTVHPEPVHVVLLGESPAGELTPVGDRIPVVVRGVSAQVSLGTLPPGDHRFAVLALSQAPQGLGEVANARLDDLFALGLVAAAQLTVIVA